MKSNLYVGLVHHPVYNKDFDIVTTSITNLDIHDIARSCKTFGIANYFIINPLITQEKLLSRIQKFWNSEIAMKYNSDRVDALSIVKYAKTIDECRKNIKNQEGENPIIISTTALQRNGQIKFQDINSIMSPVLLLFGTGNGLTEDIHKMSDFVLTPIKGVNNYNHLSVRSAVAIVLEKLTSEK
ncbi:MAG: RNA methyltransferase [Candidatus Cloacimonetes bacterium]|nr:RNA methyltransferase [Candidatus Cloacimonadota bacterium]